MTNSKAGKLDPITFVYGFGAAIVLTGAMFKFLGWPYANELFIVGLSVEVIVFLISAFERQTDEKEYQWENVFPQLDTPGSGVTKDGQLTEAASLREAITQFSGTLINLNNQMQEMGDSIQQIKTELLLNAQESNQMQNRIKEFNDQMDTYNYNLKVINGKYNKLLTQN